MFPCLMTDEKEPDICKGFFYKQSKHRFFKSWFADLYSIKFFVQFWEKKKISVTTTHILNSQRRANKKVFKYGLI